MGMILRCFWRFVRRTKCTSFPFNSLPKVPHEWELALLLPYKATAFKLLSSYDRCADRAALIDSIRDALKIASVNNCAVHSVRF